MTSCPALTTPIEERKARPCGHPVTHLVGPEKKPRCKRHAQIARNRGEVTERIKGDRRRLTGEAHPGGHGR